MGKSAGASKIDIFLRIRPVPKPSPRCVVDNPENLVEFNIPRDLAAGYVNNQREHFEFRFSGIIGAEAKQDEVFERIARPACMGALEGINGTIFAYGQTGSGKTFTITGGPERYVDRGLIPRTLTFLFSELNKRSDNNFSMHISYLEIYQEQGYDLLDPNREITELEDLPRVTIMEDDEGGIVLRNLSMHRANNEEEALNLLFLGDTNRTISETPMNMASSRSHCVFTVYIEARPNGEDLVRKSKLNLVDLAGSERIKKTGVDGQTKVEARYINLSLLYLEQVIVALQERATGGARQHIPYRNSMMTMILKDSLGGNCRTSMVATMSPAAEQLDESISTCRFAQRVAMISNKVQVNEELDPALIIKRLKGEVRTLKDEIRLLKGESAERGPLTPDELERMKTQLVSFCSSPDAELTLDLSSMMFIRAAFDIFRELLAQGGGALAAAGVGKAGSPQPSGGGGGGDADGLSNQLKKLKLQVQQRDNEINILVSMLKKREAQGARGPNPLADAGNIAAYQAARGGAPPSLAAPPGPSGAPQASAGTQGASARNGGANGPAQDQVADLMDAGVLADRNKSFELFRKSYRKNEVIEENKAMLRTKYAAAKQLGASVNQSKAKINELRALIEQRRIQRSVAGVVEGEDGEVAADPEEERIKAAMEKEKSNYKSAFGELRGLKSEIEHLQMLLEQSRVRLQKDFEQWLQLMLRQQQEGSSVTAQVLVSQNSRGPAQPPQGAQPPVVAPSLGASEGPPGPPRAAWGEAQKGGRADKVDFNGLMVDAAVVEAARPYLTGNVDADVDIVKFYEARSKLMGGANAAP